MSFKQASRTLFYLLAVGLVSFSIYYSQRVEKKQKQEETQSLIFKDQIKVSDIHQILIEKNSQIQLKLVQKENLWYLEEPLKDHADTIKVENWIQTLLSQSVMKIDTEDLMDWSDYGLDPPFADLILTHKNGNTFKVEVSDQATFDRQFFLRKEGSLLVGSSEWDTLSRAWEDDYRSRQLLSLQESPARIVFQTSEKKFSFIKDEKNKWVWQESQKNSRKFPVDEQAVQKLLQFLRTDKIEDFSPKKDFQKEKSDVFIEIEFSNKDIWTLNLKNFKEKQAQVLVSDRGYVFEVSEANTQELLGMNFEDKNFPFKFNLKDLFEIEIKTKDIHLILNKEKGLWKVTQPADHQVQPENLVGFLRGLETLRVKEVVQDFNEKDDFSETKIVLRSKGKKTLLELDIKEKGPSVFVQSLRSLEDIYSVDDGTVFQNLSSLIEKESK